MQTALLKAMALIMEGSMELEHILMVTARMSLSSSIIALLIGVPMGIWLGSCRFPGHGTLLVSFRTLMGLPPVVCGLIFYILFSGVGPLRHLKLLFTVKAMIVAQVVLITPIVVCNMESYVASIAPAVRESARGLGLSGAKTFLLLSNECVYQIISAYLLAFSRAIAEVGAVSLVGGIIQWKTRVMTTAIVLETNKGNFSFALALGMILLVISLVANILAGMLTKEERP